MGQRIEVELDDQGRLVIPHPLQEQLKLFTGATIVVEDETEDAALVRVQPAEPTLVEKDGVLVVKAGALEDLSDIVRQEREQHSSDVLRQVQMIP
jgi:bifunctional DNA-binding transcriptional regulator/antitoxin component of YhaV-PrlF toxin-antitoxin module